MINEKKKLVEVVFEQAKKETGKESVNAISSYLSTLFEDKFEFSKNEKTYSRFYKSLVKEQTNYKIDELSLYYMSKYVGYNDYEDFCSNYEDEPFTKNFGSMKVAITEIGEKNKNSTDESSKIIVNITNAPIFTIPEFLTKNKNSFGILGILIAGGIFINQKEISTTENQNLITQPTIENSSHKSQKINPETNPVITIIEKKINHIIQKENNKSISEKECMYWKSDHYEAIFCNENIIGSSVIALDEETLISLRKIDKPDTLTIHNALGKVWYDKSNNHLEFFTSHGIHPENGKTLKPISKHIIEKYINN